MKNDFDIIAPFYDQMASLVFGDRLRQIQKTYLDQIDSGSSILIVGGGTGEILEWLPQDKRLTITYVELSPKMMAKAKLRRTQLSQTDFVCKNILDHSGQFDYVIANFFLDCFDKESLHIVLDKLQDLLENDGELIVSDFLPTGHLRHKLLNYLMHGFFRLIANLASGSLLDIRSELLSNGYVEIAYRQENNGHMFSGRYQKALID